MDQQQEVVLELTAASQAKRQQHEALQFDLEAKKVAATVSCPTLPAEVRSALRQLNLPVRLFGENLANVRDRLRMELARRQVASDHNIEGDAGATLSTDGTPLQQKQPGPPKDEDQVTKYTVASQALQEARQAIAIFSLKRAAQRLECERRLRAQATALQKRKRKRSPAKIVEDDDDGHKNDDPSKVNRMTDPSNTGGDTTDCTELEQLNSDCIHSRKTARELGLEGSQYGDSRALSCMSSVVWGGANSPTSNKYGIPIVATASWTGSLHLWDASSPALEQVGQKIMCHEDRIMGMDMVSLAANNNDGEQPTAMIATTSIDLTAKLWKVKQEADVIIPDDTTERDENEPPQSSLSLTITETAHLKGHAARLCRASFHPMKQHVATTSFDHSWRLWDVETGQSLLLQDGHAAACYGVGFHPDGSLVSTTDFCGVVHVWDLRTGKSAHHYSGQHAKRVLNADFHPNGFQLATAGDDGTIKIWDLRRKQRLASIPAHSGLVTRLRFDAIETDSATTRKGGEYLASSSFDGTAKVWSCRDWKMMRELRGHEGKVSGMEILQPRSSNAQQHPSIITCGFDKTLKLWR